MLFCIPAAVSESLFFMKSRKGYEAHFCSPPKAVFVLLLPAQDYEFPVGIYGRSAPATFEIGMV